MEFLVVVFWIFHAHILREQRKELEDEVVRRGHAILTNEGLVWKTTRSD